MDQAQEPQLRNRFASRPLTSTTAPGEGISPTPEGALTPGTGDEYGGDETSATDVLEDPKESLFTGIVQRLSTTLGSGTRAEQIRKKQKAFDHSRGYDLFEKHRYEKYPEGFPRLAAWVSSSEDLEMARGFKYLYSRIILQDQVRLTDLEKRLLEADKHVASRPPPNFNFIHTREERDGNPTHKALLGEIRDGLKRYSQLVEG